MEEKGFLNRGDLEDEEFRLAYDQWLEIQISKFLHSHPGIDQAEVEEIEVLDDGEVTVIFFNGVVKQFKRAAIPWSHSEECIFLGREKP
jgi:hypothetical protein